MQPLIN